MTTGFNVAGQNISSQFGMPLYGISGWLPFGGNYFWVDTVNGSDGNTGGPQDPFKTLTQGLAACQSGNNDVIFFSGDFHPTASLAWNKNKTHLVGLAGAGSGASGTGSRISVASTTATSGAISPLVNVTGSGCIFQNIAVLSGINQAATQVAWAEAGGNNTYINVDINQVGNATAGAQAGNRALTIASLDNFFENCTIGGDQVVRATGNSATVEFLATSGRVTFRNCVFAMWSSNTANLHFTAATTTMSGFSVLMDCLLVNNLQGAGAVSLTAAASLNGSAGGLLLFDASTVSVGATKTSAAGPTYVGGPVPTATTSNLAVAGA